MQYKHYLVPVILAIAVLIFSDYEAAAGSIEGIVCDVGENPPKNGISGAEVWLKCTNGKLFREEPKITNSDGEYKIYGVTNDDYRIVVSKTGYIPNPHDEINIKVDGDVLADDVELFQRYCYTFECSSNVAANMLKKAANKPMIDRSKVIMNEWNNLIAINLPPSSKAIIANELNKRDENSKKMVPDLKYYLEAKPEKIKKAEAIFDYALTKQLALPGKLSLKHLNLNDLIIAEVFLFQLRNSNLPGAVQKANAEEFLLKWDDTVTSKRFEAIWKPDGIYK